MTADGADRRVAGVADEQEMSYEAARDELAEVVRRLEAGGTTLEESLTLWERGEQLAATCQQWLDGARARLEAVRATATRTPASDPPATD